MSDTHTHTQVVGWELAFEVVRCCCLYYAAYRLATGKTLGGDEEILALEQVSDRLV